jgi:hypothetical protein
MGAGSWNLIYVLGLDHIRIWKVKRLLFAGKYCESIVDSFGGPGGFDFGREYGLLFVFFPSGLGVIGICPVWATGGRIGPVNNKLAGWNGGLRRDVIDVYAPLLSARTD